MNKKILITIFLLTIIIITAIIISNKTIHKDDSEEQISNEEIKIEESEIENQVHQENIVNNEPTKSVEDIQVETGSTASEDIYEVQREYDGRQVLVIKPDIQFGTVLAGILKNKQPTEQDIELLDLSNFHKGVWISEVSRDKFLQILKKCEIDNFEIDKDGYLYKKYDSENEHSLKLENLINQDRFTVIDITGTCYIRDDMTGEIVEYPFKDMDLYQICETFETEGGKIFVITTNNVDEFDILQTICN